MKAILLALALMMLPLRAWAEPHRIVVAVGSNEGLPGEKPLRFADSDAARFADVMRTHGWTPAKNLTLLRAATVNEVRTAMEHAAAHAQGFNESETSFYFYFSGHGDSESLHLADGVFSLAELARATGKVRAAFKLVVTDACRTQRSKGAHTEPGFAVHLEPPPEARGVVWVHASANGEVAQESDALEGAVFSSYFVTAMRGVGDRDHDHRVSLDEAFSYAMHHARVHALRSDAAAQHPGFDATLRDASQVILSYTDAHSARLTLPPGKDTQFVVYERGSESVYAELWATSEVQTVPLPRGHYVVHRRAPYESGAIEVQLGRDEQRVLANSEFSPVARERLAQKGGLQVYPRTVALGATTSSNALTGPSLGANLHISWQSGQWHYGAGVQAEFGARDSLTQHVSSTRAQASLQIARTLVHGDAWSLHAASELGAGALWQRFDRLDAARLLGTSYATSSNASTPLLAPLLGLGARFALSPRVDILSALGAELLMTSHDDGIHLTPGLRASLGLAYRMP